MKPTWAVESPSGLMDSTDETFREYETAVDPKYLEEIRPQACLQMMCHSVRDIFFALSVLRTQQALCRAFRSKLFGKGSNILRIQVKHLVIRFYRISFCLPSRYSALEEFDPKEMKSQCATQNGAAGFVAWTGAVENCVFFWRDE